MGPRMSQSSKIYVAGHAGMVGHALVEVLQAKGYQNLILRSSKDLDLRDARQVTDFFAAEKPEYVLFAAGKVGGIGANQQNPTVFLHDNLVMGLNVLQAARKHGVSKLINLASSCIYPRQCAQPMHESSLWQGPLEPTNEGYAVAKLAVLKFAQSLFQHEGHNFFSLIPPNLYGCHDHFDLQTGHVVSSLIQRFHQAKTQAGSDISLWGSGKARRELMYVADLANAVVFFLEGMDAQDLEHGICNVGTGMDCTILELAHMIQECTGFSGQIFWDTSKPDGMPKKCLDVSQLQGLGWQHATSLREGLQKTYDWFLKKEPGR